MTEIRVSVENIAVRMRRFYIRPVFRRNRVGRRLATALLNRVSVGRPITVNAAPASFSFWASGSQSGFSPITAMAIHTSS
jgi:hypothetical protein